MDPKARAEEVIRSSRRMASEAAHEVETIAAAFSSAQEAFRRMAETFVGSAYSKGGVFDAFNGFDDGRYRQYGDGRPQSRPAPSTHLTALGLQPGYTPDELKAAYRQRVRETHPDVGGSAEEFRKVQAAWEALR